MKEEEEPLASLREDPLSRDEEMTHHFQLSLRDFYFYKNFLVDDLKWTSWKMASAACGILGFPFMSIVQPSEEEL
ncbi:hypothetical protein PRUPE_4G278000 [Prunus persica]|uniref:Uncharacterized protein n=1 Tax=Prunus persica TaxID=3760 RepID=A0A251PS32_PRUPE|nr:hypothetical protein PRUPE_4G278000 [Prunus persica]